MFGSEIKFVTFIYICTLLFILVIVFVGILKTKGNKNFNYKFFILTLSVLLNNISSGLFPDKNLKINILSQNIIAYTIGLVTIAYYAYYLSLYYNLTFRSYLKFNYIIIFLSVNLVVGFIIPYTITDNLQISRRIFLVFPVLLIFLLLYIIYKSQFSSYFGFKNKYEEFHSLAGLAGIISVVSVPITMLLLGDDQTVEQTLFTLGYFFICIEYFLYKNSIQQVYSYDLTDRESEILNLIINDKKIKYTEISIKLNISEKTVSTHLSNIYKKVDVKSKKELIKRINEKNL